MPDGPSEPLLAGGPEPLVTDGPEPARAVRTSPLAAEAPDREGPAPSSAEALGVAASPGREQRAVERALALALRHLARRERTEAEVRAHLAAKGVEPAAADAAVAELVHAHLLDDAGYARRFAEDRRALDAWGAERIERRLREAGVAAHHIAAALGGHERDDERDAALALLRRRFPAPPQTDRDRERALGVLVRRGYELELAYDVVRAYAGGEQAGA